MNLTMSDPLSSLALSCRRLFLRNHVVDVRIGAHDFEKHAPQRIVFNVELFVPLNGTTPTRDDLAEVVDYDYAVSYTHLTLPTTSRV